MICCGLVIVGAVAPVAVVWDLVDFMSAFLVFFNVIALLGLSKYVVYVLKDYGTRKKMGEKDPVWDEDNDVTRMNLSKISTEQK